MKKTQTKFLVGSLIVVGAISYLVYAGIKETSVYYLTVSEVSSIAKPGEDFRMEGKVVPGSIKKDANSMGAQFLITDSKKEIPISYKGIIPDMFSDDIDVVVQGMLDPEGLFNAHTLLTSCPSRYEAEDGSEGEGAYGGDNKSGAYGEIPQGGKTHKGDPSDAGI